MNILKKKTKRISNAIRGILLKDWDPIGIYSAGPDDEYDSYIWPIFKLIRNGANVTEISDYLYKLEKDIIGSYPESRDQIKIASERLVSLKSKMNFY